MENRTVRLWEKTMTHAIHCRSCMLYECRFCEQGFVGHPGESCPDCGADDAEFPEGYLKTCPAGPETAYKREPGSRNREGTSTM